MLYVLVNIWPIYLLLNLQSITSLLILYKIFRFTEEFCFSPKTDLLRVDTPHLKDFDLTSAYRILSPLYFYRET